MKKILLLAGLLLNTSIILGQQEQHLGVLEADSTWIKEIIKFPIGFAQEIKFEGFEDLRFPQGWSNQDSPNFWSYVWAWSLNNVEGLTTNDLEKNIQFYFDGLLGLNNSPENKKNTLKTNAIFIKNQDATNNIQYIGKVKTLDTRYTKKPMTLNAEVEHYYCKQQKKSIILFRFSPKEFVSNVWQTLNKVKLQGNFCKFN
jgi:hypothetical protein